MIYTRAHACTRSLSLLPSSRFALPLFFCSPSPPPPPLFRAYFECRALSRSSGDTSTRACVRAYARARTHTHPSFKHHTRITSPSPQPPHPLPPTHPPTPTSTLTPSIHGPHANNSGGGCGAGGDLGGCGNGVRVRRMRASCACTRGGGLLWPGGGCEYRSTTGSSVCVCVFVRARAWQW